jgi:hypothetical protein
MAVACSRDVETIKAEPPRAVDATADVITEDAETTYDADECEGLGGLLAHGYRDCSLHTLSACENSNQLFFGPDDRCGNATPKEEIWDALAHFLKGAPTPYDTADAGSAASDIGEALLGPGTRQRLASGEWFFSGFTPHAAPEQAAALFDAHGDIIAVALLDAPPPAFSLYVYSHGVLRVDYRECFRAWALSVVSEAASRFDQAIAIELDSKRWITKRGQ